MILRIVTGRVEPGRIEAVRESFRETYIPIAARAVGLERYTLGSRSRPDGGDELAAVTLWRTLDDARTAYGGNLAALRTLDGRDHGASLTRVDFYEIDAEGAQRRPGRPVHLRLTAGTIPRGHDADIQQELRRRLPELPSEALEAYIGRRVRGKDVEIAFLSTWSGSPDGWVLDAPIWPMISDRYDSFRIALLEIFAEGSGAV